MSIVLIIGTGR